MRGRRIGLGSGIAVALALAGVAVAPAGTPTSGSDTVDGITYKYSSFKVGPPARNSGEVTCPNQKPISSAGIENLDVPEGRWHASAPTDGPDADKRPDDGWTFAVTKGAGEDPPGRGKAALTAICQGPRTYETKTPSPRRGETKVFHVACPTNQHVTGGGVVMPRNRYGFIVGSSFPYDSNDPDPFTDDGWAVRGKVTSKKRRPLRITAICRNEEVFYEEETTTLMSDGTSDIVSENCLGEGHVLGIGARLAAKYSQGGRFGWFLNPNDDLLLGDPDTAPDDFGWGRARLVPGSAAAEYTVFLMCTPVN